MFPPQELELVLQEAQPAIEPAATKAMSPTKLNSRAILIEIKLYVFSVAGTFSIARQ